jgi:hypothetical protein
VDVKRELSRLGRNWRDQGAAVGLALVVGDQNIAARW